MRKSILAMIVRSATLSYAVSWLLVLTCGVEAFAQIWPTQRDDAYWVVVRDNDGSPFPTDRVGLAQQRFIQMGHFLARNSGGRLQYDLAAVLDAPIALNADGTRPSDWVQTVHGLVNQQYGIDLNAMKGNGPGVAIRDLSLTTKDPGQGWTGSASNGGHVRLQFIGERITIHEFGHVIGLGHTKGYRGGNYRYEWDSASQAYVPYSHSSGDDGHQPMPYGVERKKYGHGNSVMGSFGIGSFPTFQKRSKGWLGNATHKVLDMEAAKLDWDDYAETIRIYAHNDLETVTSTGRTGRTLYGVQQGYDQSLTYSLEFAREVMVFDSFSGEFAPIPQNVLLEFAIDTDKERPGIYTYLNTNDTGWINVDVNKWKGWQLNQGTTAEFSELQLGTSIFWVDNGDSSTDFLSLSPPPPPDPLEVRPEWFSWRIVDQGITDARNWLDVEFRINGVDSTSSGDFDLDSDIDGADFLAWQRDPSVGDLSVWQTNYGTTVGLLGVGSTAVPEPSTLVLLGIFVSFSGVAFAGPSKRARTG